MSHLCLRKRVYTALAIIAAMSASSHLASAAPPPPAPPFNVHAIYGPSGVTVTWQTHGATSYKIYRSTTVDGELASPPIAVGVVGTSYLDTTASLTTPYFYKVQATNGSGNSPISNEGGAVPAPPSGVHATYHSGGVTVAWNSAIGASSYKIYRGTTSDGELSSPPLVTGVSATGYVDATAVSSTQYFYKVQATCPGGNSQIGDETAAITGPVANLTSQGGNTQITLRWDTTVAATSYKIYRSTTPGAELSSPAVATSGFAGFTDTGLTNGTVYYYKVQAIAPGGFGSNVFGETHAAANSALPGLYVTAFNGSVLNSGDFFHYDDISGANPVQFGAGTFHIPGQIALDTQGRIYIADQASNRIVRMDDIHGANFTTFNGGVHGSLSTPEGVAVDNAGHIYIADTVNNRIVRVDDMTGTGWTTLGGTASGAGVDQFNGPDQLAFDSGGRLYIADNGNSRLVRIDGITGGNWASYVGPFREHGISGVAIDQAGHIYTTGGDGIIEMDDMAGTNTRFEGHNGSGSGVNQFFAPQGIVVDAQGAIYVADDVNQRIVKMNDITGAGWTTLAVGMQPIGIAVR